MKHTRTQTYTHTNKNKREFACQSRLSKCDRRKCYETGLPFELSLAVRIRRRSCGSLSLLDPQLAYFGGDLGFLRPSKRFSWWTSMDRPVLSETHGADSCQSYAYSGTAPRHQYLTFWHKQNKKCPKHLFSNNNKKWNKPNKALFFNSRQVRGMYGDGNAAHCDVLASIRWPNILFSIQGELSSTPRNLSH